MYLLMDVSKAMQAATPGIVWGNHTILAGGGEFAIQTAMQCKENGADNITVILRDSKNDSGLSAETLDKATEKGVHLIFGGAINKISGEKDQLNEIEYMDRTHGTQHTLPANTLVIASGRFPELIFARPVLDKPDTPEDTDVEEDSTQNGHWEGFYALKHPHYSTEIGLLAQGDTLSDFSGAIKAIGAGRRAAASIHNVIYGIPLSHPDNVLTPVAMIQDVSKIAHVEQLSRTIMPLASAPERLMDTEIEKGFSEKMAEKEADRCLQCGLICYAKTGTDNN
jgi:formate dehydrogenase (NADP+) beta subunit